MDVGAWYAYLARAGTSREIVMKLNSVIGAVLADREFVEKNMVSQGMAPMQMTPEQIAKFIRSETERMARLVKLSGVRVE
jgi:tripartite-type tricarboxylate transporter receptor subunit TctC